MVSSLRCSCVTIKWGPSTLVLFPLQLGDFCLQQHTECAPLLNNSRCTWLLCLPRRRSWIWRFLFCTLLSSAQFRSCLQTSCHFRSSTYILQPQYDQTHQTFILYSFSAHVLFNSVWFSFFSKMGTSRSQGRNSASTLAAALVLLVLADCALAATVNVGGSSGWTLGYNYKTWASTAKVRPYDSLCKSCRRVHLAVNVLHRSHEAKKYGIVVSWLPITSSLSLR